MGSQQEKYRRASLLLITLIVLILALSCASEPLLLSFALGFAIGIVSFIIFFHWLLTN